MAHFISNELFIVLLLRRAPQALSDDHVLRQLFWLLHAPTSLDCLAAALRLLRAVAAAPAAAAVAALQGGYVFLLEVLLHRGPWPWQQHGGAAGGSATSAGAGTGGAGAQGTSGTGGGEKGGGGGAGAVDGAAEDEVRCEAAALLGRLMAHATHGSLIRLAAQRLLPPGMVATIAEGPPQAVLQVGWSTREMGAVVS